jgi:16S rRNA (adenine1518-N6/adenine1519-N6)-dimethyltransferase
MEVTAFEVDPGLCSFLEELFSPYGERFRLIRGDVLKTWETLDDGSPYLLGNLPYTVAAPLLGNLIEGGRFFTRLAVTLQKEVARRAAASPGSGDYSSLSVLSASAYTVKVIMTLKGGSFYPPPHVESTALVFERRRDLAPPPPLFYPLARALFASRRKTVANNLERFLAGSCKFKAGTAGTAAALRDAMEAALDQSGIEGGERAERLSPEAFVSLAAALELYFEENRE